MQMHISLMVPFAHQFKPFWFFVHYEVIPHSVNVNQSQDKCLFTGSLILVFDITETIYDPY